MKIFAKVTCEDFFEATVFLPVQKAFVFLFTFKLFSVVAFFYDANASFHFFSAISKQHHIINVQKFVQTIIFYFFCNLIHDHCKQSRNTTEHG